MRRGKSRRDSRSSRLCLSVFIAKQNVFLLFSRKQNLRRSVAAVPSYHCAERSCRRIRLGCRFADMIFIRHVNGKFAVKARRKGGGFLQRDIRQNIGRKGIKHDCLVNAVGKPDGQLLH